MGKNGRRSGCLDCRSVYFRKKKSAVCTELRVTVNLKLLFSTGWRSIVTFNLHHKLIHVIPYVQQRRHSRITASYHYDIVPFVRPAFCMFRVRFFFISVVQYGSCPSNQKKYNYCRSGGKFTTLNAPVVVAPTPDQMVCWYRLSKLPNFVILHTKRIWKNFRFYPTIHPGWNIIEICVWVKFCDISFSHHTYDDGGEELTPSRPTAVPNVRNNWNARLVGLSSYDIIFIFIPFDIGFSLR